MIVIASLISLFIGLFFGFSIAIIMLSKDMYYSLKRREDIFNEIW